MPRTGRPKIEIKQDLFEGLCGIFCTKSEICSALKVSEPTLRRWVARTYAGQTFDAVYSQKCEVGKISIRRAQVKLATSGNATMLIWLGKQMLGQQDRLEMTGADGGPIRSEVTITQQDAVKIMYDKFRTRGLNHADACLKLVEEHEVDPADLPTEPVASV